MGSRHTHPLHVHGHSRLHRLAPHVKVLALVGYAGALASVPVGAEWAFVCLGVLLAVAVAVSHLPLSFIASRAVVVVPFVVSGLAVPFIASGHDASIGSLGYSTAGLHAGVAIASRAVLGVVASIVVAGTTELPRLLAGLQRLRVPGPIVEIASFMLRYLDLVAAELGRMRSAMVARGHDPRWLWQARPMAAAAGALFVRTYERGERVHLAMQARGYAGHMPRLHVEQVSRADWAITATWVALAVAVVAVARVLA